MVRTEEISLTETWKQILTNGSEPEDTPGTPAATGTKPGTAVVAGVGPLWSVCAGVNDSSGELTRVSPVATVTLAAEATSTTGEVAASVTSGQIAVKDQSLSLHNGKGTSFKGLIVSVCISFISHQSLQLGHQGLMSHLCYLLVHHPDTSLHLRGRRVYWETKNRKETCSISIHLQGSV